MRQIGLEMQNEELRRSHLLLEETRDKYIDLYDFAPRFFSPFDWFSEAVRQLGLLTGPEGSSLRQ